MNLLFTPEKLNAFIWTLPRQPSIQRTYLRLEANTRNTILSLSLCYS